MLPGIPTSGDGAASQQTSSAAVAAGSDLGFSEDEKGRPEDGGRSSGNRWPRQETLYLLQIRSDMDAAFRDSSLKGPLWDEVSRKLASLGFHRSAKKCKEKFENVYKYHKRIKEGRSSKADGKTYKFFEQLQALEASPSNHNQPPLALPPPPVVSNPPMPIASAPALQNNNVDPISVAAPAVNVNPISGRFSFSQLNMSVSNSSSSSTSSDDEPPERRRSRKRKWKEFFGKLMTEVINKQEELQSKFLDTLDRRERDRTAREEAWRLQEMAKMKREHELLVQERSMVAAKDAAVITLLQKITEQNPNSNPKAGTGIPQIPAMQLLQQQQNHPSPPQLTPQPPPLAVNPVPVPAQVPVSVPVPVPVPAPVPVSVPLPASASPPQAVKNLGNASGGEAESMLQPSPSRWPKAEIDALINLRTTLENKYQENGPKGPLWEEVSAAMRNLGYNRNAKRCKEKWENINKYYKKVKESSKKRPEDSKTCPYFHQLDAIYREKASGSSNSNNNNNYNPGLTLKTETQMAPIMARPEQQWPLLAAVQEHQHHQYQQQQQQQLLKPSEPIGGIENHPNADLNEDEYDDDEEDDDDEDEEDDGGDYEVVPNKTASMA